MTDPTATTGTPAAAACSACPAYRAARLKKLGVDMGSWDFVVALAGNPNTGKSTVFNALTGLRQHTGNWPGKTVVRAEGGFSYGDQRFKLVDLPGTYSLMAGSPDEVVARDFLLFGAPDVTLVVVDASRLERNLNLALQVLQVTDRVVVCLNLMDEAQRRGLEVDARRLARDLGVPVVPTAARFGKGLPELLDAIHEVATGATSCRPLRLRPPADDLRNALDAIESRVLAIHPALPNARWVAMRLLDGDQAIAQALRSGELGSQGERRTPDARTIAAIESALTDAEDRRREKLAHHFHERITEVIYAEAARLADRAVTRPDSGRRFDLDRAIDRVVTSRRWGFPLMLVLLAGVFWLTLAGSNVPAKWLEELLVGTIHPWLREVTGGWPWWLAGFLVDGVYLSTAWVVAVMLPPMAIFFPLFTLLEDLGYLPRVAFNLDGFFKKAGAHGKQAMTMVMGFGCNAAGVVATRIIDSPRERLLAILTNNFSLCNGRWPLQITLASLFIAALAPGGRDSLAGATTAALAVAGVATLGMVFTFAATRALSRTVLKGEPSVFSLELPPYRPPRVLRTIYTSLIERTLIVLGRAVAFAAPAGAVIWLAANIHAGGHSLAAHAVWFLDPFGIALGLNGIILLAYVLAIPANEIVIPTIVMLSLMVLGGADASPLGTTLVEAESDAELLRLLHAGGWTLLTAVNLMLFSLLHNPCGTTILTIYRETRSAKWTTLAVAMPLALGFAVTFLVAAVWRALAG
ncbi:MAG: ferrous iron transport protein B [Akkermansiaceae bacterium]|nr:ferrous iron transport protein B [Akkermansiaceae bacterium]